MDRPIGIGIIVVSVNTILEPELTRAAPSEVALHFTRGRMRSEDPAELQRMVDQAPEAAELLADAGVQVIVFACTAASMFRGPGQDQAIVERIQARTGLPALATSGAVCKAFAALGMTRIALASPYSDRMNQTEADYFRAAGIEVVRMRGLACQGGDMALVPPDEVYRNGLAVDTPAADGIFLSCTNWPTLEIIEKLERAAGKPVTSSNQATLWAALRMAGVKDAVPGYGKLFHW